MTSSLSIQTFYCTQEKLTARTVTPGSIYYTTDTHSVYIDSADSKRYLYDSVICVDDATALEALKTAYTPSNRKLYYNRANKNIYIYNGTSFVAISAPSEDILASVESQYGVEVVSALPTKGATDKIYLIPATDALDGITKDMYAYDGTNFIKLNPSKTAVTAVADAELISVLQSIDTKLTAILADF